MTPLTVVAVLGLTGCSTVLDSLGMSEPAEETPWAEQVVTLTQADLASLHSVRYTDAFNRGMMPASVAEAQVYLHDANGQTRVDLLFGERDVWHLQRTTAGEQTAAMQLLHGTVLEALREHATGGWFSSDSGAQLGIDSWVAERTAEDLILAVGFESMGGRHLYATTTSDRVDFDPDAPKATGPRATVAAAAPTSGKGKDKDKKDKKGGGKGFFESAMKGLEMAQSAADTYNSLAGK